MANECTPFWYSHCPKCGNCTCKVPSGTLDPMCPLHGYESLHDMPQIASLPPGHKEPRRRRGFDADGPSRR